MTKKTTIDEFELEATTEKQQDDVLSKLKIYQKDCLGNFNRYYIERINLKPWQLLKKIKVISLEHFFLGKHDAYTKVIDLLEGTNEKCN